MIGQPTSEPAAPATTPPEGEGESHAPFDLFDLFDIGRRAVAARDALLGPRAFFVRSRQLLASGAWRGPRDAAESYVEAADLTPAAPTGTGTGGLAGAVAAGARLLVGADPAAHHAARSVPYTSELRSLWRFRFRSGESAADRQARLRELGGLVAGGPPWGIMPTPLGEPEGLDTLRLVATLRLSFPAVRHVVLDVAGLGPRLAQMALGFGGDELWAPIVSERALRLGGNANNPAMTRKEAAVLIRGAGLAACERLGADLFSEEIPST